RQQRARGYQWVRERSRYCDLSAGHRSGGLDGAQRERSAARPRRPLRGSSRQTSRRRSSRTRAGARDRRSAHAKFTTNRSRYRQGSCQRGSGRVLELPQTFICFSSEIGLALARATVAALMQNLQRIEAAIAKGHVSEAAGEYLNYRKLSFASAPLALQAAEQWSLFNPDRHAPSAARSTTGQGN